MPAIRRTLKNVVKNYSDSQVKVREATSNDPWGPSSTLMSEIADLTYNVIAFTDIMQMVWKRLNDDGKNWRHVYKSLVVLDYIIKTGSEKVAQQCKENFHAIKTLTSFQYIDADNKDQGINVREKAKQLVTLLSDDERLKNERAKALKAKERFAQNAMGVGNGPTRTRAKLSGSPTAGGGGGGSPSDTRASPGSTSSPNELECARPSSAGEEELQLQLALAMSKEEHDETVRKLKSDDIKLQMALEESREQAKTGDGTLLTLSGPGTSTTDQARTKDPWGAPLPATQPPPQTKDPWGAPLPPPHAKLDPWDSGSGGGGGRMDLPPAYSPTQQQASTSSAMASTPSQATADPWGLPVSNPPPAQTGEWGSSVPSSSQAAPWGAGSASGAGGLDAFGAPATNGATTGGTTIDSEFDLLSARSNESSPVKTSTQGLEEFDLLAGGSTRTNGTSGGAGGGAWDMNELGENKQKKAAAFLGDNANLVNLDQLVSKAPPKGNNPFAMTVGASNPFQDPNAGVRVPMAQMQGGTIAAPAPGFSQPVSGGLLPSPMVPHGTNLPMQPQPHPQQPQQGYNPFL